MSLENAMNQSNKREDDLKLILVGDSAVGKTCLLLTYLHGTFPEEYIPTIIDGYQKKIANLDVSLVDTAGRYDYDIIRPQSYVNTDIVLVCFSISSPDSLARVSSEWLPEVERHGHGCALLLVGTKLDLRSDPDVLAKITPVANAEGKAMAKRIGAGGYVECSSFKGINLEKVFSTAVSIVQKKSKVVSKSSCILL